MKIHSPYTISNQELTQIRFRLFQYWREGTKLKDILQDNKVWTESFISDQLKIIMESWFSGDKYYGGVK